MKFHRILLFAAILLLIYPNHATPQQEKREPSAPIAESDSSPTDAEMFKQVRKAAERGDISAQYNLGMMYFLGNETPQDYIEAEKWFRKAAERSNTSAQCMLGVIYATGLGGTRDYVKAYIWLTLSTDGAKGEPAPFLQKATELRNSVAKNMTLQQIRKAIRLATEFRSDQYIILDIKASEDIPNVSSGLGDVHCIATDSQGNMYLSLLSFNVVVRMDSDGTITRIAGTGAFSYGGDNGPAMRAKLAHPWGIAVDSAGDLYIADSTNYRIRKISNGIITTVAGTGKHGYNGENRKATKAMIGMPTDIAIDSVGNLYFAEGELHRVRKFSNGVITTVAGTGRNGYGGDNGPATEAQLWNPTGVAVDSSGNLYISERRRVRKVTNGIITTVAGNNGQGYSGDNGPAVAATFGQVEDIAVDSDGNLYIADVMYNCIRKVSNGVVTTIAGNGTPGFSGDNGPAVEAQLHGPRSIHIDSAGDLYFVDRSNRRIRKVSDGVITSLPVKGF